MDAAARPTISMPDIVALALRGKAVECRALIDGTLAPFVVQSALCAQCLTILNVAKPINWIALLKYWTKEAVCERKAGDDDA